MFSFNKFLKFLHWSWVRPITFYGLLDTVNPFSSDFLMLDEIAGDDWNPLDPGDPAAPPDFTGAAEAEAAAAMEIFGQQHYDVNLPEGSLEWYQDPVTGMWTQNISYSPEQQALYDKNTQAALDQADMAALANQQIADIFADPFVLDDFETYDEQFYDDYLERLETDINKDWEQTQSNLYASGHSPGDQGYQYEQMGTERALNDARSQAYLAAQDAALKERQQIVEEELFQRTQPINEYSAWRTGSQIATPTFQSQNLAPPAPPQYLNAADMQAQYDLGIYNADVAQSNALMGGLFSLGTAAIA